MVTLWPSQSMSNHPFSSISPETTLMVALVGTVMAILNLLSGNPTNEPLKLGAVTLSRTDLITFK